MLRDIFRIVLVFTILYISVTIILIYINEQLAVLTIVAIPVFLLWFAKYLADNVKYKCNKCGHEFKISAKDVLLSLQQLYIRLLRCPNCKASSWCRVVVYKDKEIKAKFKQIDENVKTNHRVLLIILIVSYLLFLVFWFLNREFVFFIAMTLVYLYLIAVVAYGMRNNLNSNMYAVITFIALFLTFIASFIQVITYLTGVLK